MFQKMAMKIQRGRSTSKPKEETAALVFENKCQHKKIGKNHQNNEKKGK